jgi:hypothetical protein
VRGGAAVSPGESSEGGWSRGFVKQIGAAVLVRQLSEPQPSPRDPQQGYSITRVRHARSDDNTLGRFRPINLGGIHALLSPCAIMIMPAMRR